MEEKKKVAWWRYILALLIFVLTFFLVPAIVYLFRWLIDVFSIYTKESAAERLLMSYVLTPFFANALAETALGKKNIFLVVLCAVAGAYSIFVATWNYLLGKNSLYETIALGIAGLIYFGLAVWDGIQIGKEIGKTEKEETGDNGHHT